MCSGHAGLHQRITAVTDHAVRPAQECRGQAGRTDQPGIDKTGDLGTINAAIQHIDIPRLTRQHMHQPQPVQIPVLHILDQIAEHDRGCVAIAIYQRHLRRPAGGKGCAGD